LRNRTLYPLVVSFLVAIAGCGGSPLAANPPAEPELAACVVGE